MFSFMVSPHCWIKPSCCTTTNHKTLLGFRVIWLHLWKIKSVILHLWHWITSFSSLTSCSMQAAARILTTLLGLIRTSSRYRDPNTTCRATHKKTQSAISKNIYTSTVDCWFLWLKCSHPQCLCSGPGSPSRFPSCLTPSKSRWTYWKNIPTAKWKKDKELTSDDDPYERVYQWLSLRCFVFYFTWHRYTLWRFHSCPRAQMRMSLFSPFRNKVW